MNSSLFAKQAVEHLEQRIYDCLTKCIGRFRDFLVRHVASGNGKIAPLVSDNCPGSFDGPLREISTALNCKRFRRRIVLSHLLFLLEWRFKNGGALGFAYAQFPRYLQRSDNKAQQVASGNDRPARLIQHNQAAGAVVS